MVISTLADPIDIEKGPDKAKVFIGNNGEVMIHSFAHGNILYRLRHDYASLVSAIETAEKKDAAKVLCSLIVIADIDQIEEDLLIALAAERTRGGLKPTRREP